MASRRAARVAERIREEASQMILYHLRDPRLHLVTVTKVDISSDLRYATVYFSVLGDEGRRRTAMRGLESARGRIQSHIGRSLGLRDSPVIRFQFDPSIEKAIEVAKLIDEVAAEFKDDEQEGDEEEPSDDDQSGPEEQPPHADEPPPQ
ncbi:MAG: 30S ribosome-binding factor RbfA [Candidatus Brocadiia bacterium]